MTDQRPRPTPSSDWLLSAMVFVIFFRVCVGGWHRAECSRACDPLPAVTDGPFWVCHCDPTLVDPSEVP